MLYTCSRLLPLCINLSASKQWKSQGHQTCRPSKSASSCGRALTERQVLICCRNPSYALRAHGNKNHMTHVSAQCAARSLGSLAPWFRPETGMPALTSHGSTSQAQKNGTRHTVYWTTGEQYTGAWKNNKRHGEAISGRFSSSLQLVSRPRLGAAFIRSLFCPGCG